MSLCLVVETKDCVWIGADSAVSYNVGSKTYRGRGEVYEKTFHHGNAIFFTCGSIYNAGKIRKYIETLPKVAHTDMYKIADEMKRLSVEGRIFNHKNVRNAIIAVLCDTGRVYGINENDGFAVESPMMPELNGYKSICCVGLDNEASIRGGAMASECADIKYTGITDNIPEIYRQIYSVLSCNGIGGHVDLFCVNIKEQTITKFHVPIVENEIEYLDAHAQMGAGSHINWSVVNTPSAQQVGARPDSWMPSWANIQALHGQIQGTHISQNAIMTGHIAANQISAGHIATNAISSNHIQAGAITAEKIAANAIITNRIQSMQFPTSRLEVGNNSWGDLTWFNQGQQMWAIWGEGTSFQMRAFGTPFLSTSGNFTILSGSWDFRQVPTVNGSPLATSAQITALQSAITALTARVAALERA